jgi:hypothetical protein
MIPRVSFWVELEDLSLLKVLPTIDFEHLVWMCVQRLSGNSAIEDRRMMGMLVEEQYLNNV